MSLAPANDPAATLAALRAAGAAQIDPVRLRYLEALARRSGHPQGDARLATLLADYTARLEKARSEADALLARACGEFPDAADELTALHAGNHFAQLRQHVARLESSWRGTVLADLVTHLDQRKRSAPEGTPAVAISVSGNQALLHRGRAGRTRCARSWHRSLREALFLRR